MSLITVAKREDTELAEFKPQAARENIAKADALIDLAKRLHDWPLLETAVDHKMGEQEEFVRWWRENVRERGQRANVAVPGLFTSDAEERTGITKQQVSKWSKRLADKPKYRASLYEAAWRKAMSEKGQTDLRGASGTGENEWYTPNDYVERARAVLGSIDLDPASSAIANAVVKAEQFFTEETNGLEQEWSGNVWLNPPYAQPAIAYFANKMATEWASGRVTAAIVLTHNYTDTAWFHTLAKAATAICFTRGRVRFVSPTGELAAPTQGQAFFYFGSDVDIFADVFGQVGFVAEVRQ